MAPRIGVAVFALALVVAASAVALLPSPADAGGAMVEPGRRQMASTCDGGGIGDCDVDGDGEEEVEELAAAAMLMGGAGGAMRRSMAAAAAATRKYISRAALSADEVPCSKKGRSYYHNCANQTAAAADPYRRGCAGITRCHNATIN